MVDEDRLGSPPVELQVEQGRHYVTWLIDGEDHTCAFDVGSGGKRVRMDLDDPICP